MAATANACVVCKRGWMEVAAHSWIEMGNDDEAKLRLAASSQSADQVGRVSYTVLRAARRIQLALCRLQCRRLYPGIFRLDHITYKNEKSILS